VTGPANDDLGEVLYLSRRSISIWVDVRHAEIKSKIWHKELPSGRCVPILIRSSLIWMYSIKINTNAPYKSSNFCIGGTHSPNLTFSGQVTTHIQTAGFMKEMTQNYHSRTSKHTHSRQQAHSAHTLAVHSTTQLEGMLQ
jgi:hypothetical protein